MTENETAFWERLRRALRNKGFELFLMAHYAPGSPADVPVLVVRNGLDQIPDGGGYQGWRAFLPSVAGLDEEMLLEREEFWRGPSPETKGYIERRKAVTFYYSFYASALQWLRPSLVVIWNGEHPQELILRALCSQNNHPVLFIERGPFKDTIQIDAEGILGCSSIAKAHEWGWEIAGDRATWERVNRDLNTRRKRDKETWWEQPDAVGPEQLITRLGISPQQKVVLFVGQIDNDTQSLLCSPHFTTNLNAFQWLCENLKPFEDIFVLGKHHPKSASGPDVFARTIEETIGSRGAWLSDVAITDCIALADSVVAVNSTVLYEALLAEKPILMLGQSLLSHKGIAYELHGTSDPGNLIQQWLDKDEWPKRLEKWHEYCSYLIAHHLISMKKLDELHGLRGADALADYFAPLAESSETPSNSSNPTPWPCLEEVHLYDQARHKLNPKDAERRGHIALSTNHFIRRVMAKMLPGGLKKM